MSKTIHRLPLRQLRANPSNPRTITQAKLVKLVQSLRQFPQMLELRPLVVESLDNPVVLGGNMRLRALQQLGVEEVPVLEASELSAEQRGEFVIKDNVGFGEWDWEALANEWDPVELSDWGLDIPDLAAESASVEEDEVPELPSEPLTKPGDLWILGRHRLLCGDSTKAEDVERLMANDRADLLLTDPPYNVNYEGATGLKIQNDSMPDKQFRQFLNDAFKCAFDACKPGSSFYIWHADLEGYNFRGAVADCQQKVRQCLIWAKSSLVMGRQDYQWQHEPCLYGWKGGASHGWYSDRKQTTLLYFEKPSKNNEHPTMKPVSLFAYLMGNSTAPQGIAYDPFLGSGTTLIAAEQLGRTCYGMELDPKYCDVIVARWEKLTGQQAARSYNLNEPNEK